MEASLTLQGGKKPKAKTLSKRQCHPSDPDEAYPEAKKLYEQAEKLRREGKAAGSEAADSTPLDPDRPTPPPRQAEETEAIQLAPSEGGAPHPAASEPPAGEGAFAAWATARAVPIGLVGLGVVAVAVALGSLGMKHARHRNEVMRRYRP